jgi:hypothetical protein
MSGPIVFVSMKINAGPVVASTFQKKKSSRVNVTKRF